MSKESIKYESRRDYSILFADIKGFSSLKPFQQKLYLREVLPRIAAAVEKEGNSPEQINTWGDGIAAFFSAHTSAVRCSLHLRDMFRTTAWKDLGLPSLKIRISLNAGEVFVGYNAVRKSEELIGTEVNRAARLEPVVMPNHVYATAAFASRCKDHMVKFQLVGEVELPKGWGAEQIYVASWEDEVLDPKTVTSSALQGRQGILLYPHSCNFGKRLLVSTTAKAMIARYCTQSGFWRSDDVVFVESGTLPVFMLLDLYRDIKVSQCPQLLITNNIACSTVTMMAQMAVDQSVALFPEDVPTNMIMTGGRILDEYAAALPEDLMEPAEKGLWETRTLIEYFQSKQVNHVIMMVSKLTRVDGPCAVGAPMRRFKKALLRYVAENNGIRLSILAEADKLVDRRGFPVDTIGLPDECRRGYWEEALEGGCITVICALSPEMEGAQVGMAKREMRQLRDAGACPVLLGLDGVPMTL